MSGQASSLKRKKKTYSTTRFLVVFATVSSAYWLLESLFHTYILHSGPIAETLTQPGFHETWQRISVIAIIFASLFICTKLKDRLRKNEMETSLTKWKEALISENISEHMIFYDKDFLIQWANEPAASSLNMTPSELVGKLCYELWHKRNEPCEFCPVIRAMETGTAQEEFVSTPDGRHWYIRGYPIIGDDGQLEGAAEITLEITKLKEAEREARDKNARLEAILRSVSDGVVMTDQRGIVTYVNNSFERTLCASREEAIGKHINHLIFLKDPNKSHRITVPISKVLTLGHGDSVTCKGVLKCSDGSRKLISISCSPIISRDTMETKGMVLSIRDITQNEKALETFFKEKKSESLGKFALGIAHELNNIIHSISSNLSLIKTGLKIHAEKNESLDDIDAATAMLKNLSEELRCYAGETKPSAAKIPITRIISETASSIFQDGNLMLTQFIDRGIPTIEADGEKITRAFEAIMLFIKELARDGSEIELSVSTVRAPGEGEPAALNENYILTSIKVNQYIVSKDRINDLFDPYSSGGHSGTGLKLSIANSIIESHGGHIEVISSIDSGTEFRIYLPAFKKEETVAAPMVTGDKKAEGRILAMDDDEIVRKALKKILEFYGFEVVLAANGEEAVEKYREAMSSGKPIDAAIIDLTVKHGMGGKETGKKILELDKNARLVISSGYKSDRVMVDYKQYGFKAAIAKPYKAEKLNKVLSEILSTETPIK